MTIEAALTERRRHTSRIVQRCWLTKGVFILRLERPANFRFTAGQCLRLHRNGKVRDYSLIPGDHPNELELLIRAVTGGCVSRHLSDCPLKTPLAFNGPIGHFIYRPSPRQAVFIATGTGIAPFAAMARSGVTGFILLHGVRNAGELYYRNLLEPVAKRLIPCLSDPAAVLPDEAFPGRATRFLQTQMAPGDYDFYLAGRREMIADAMAIVDDRFPSSRVYTEIFF